MDDSIVVVGKYRRWMRDGHSRLDELSKPQSKLDGVVGCTATNYALCHLSFYRKAQVISSGVAMAVISPCLPRWLFHYSHSFCQAGC